MGASGSWPNFSACGVHFSQECHATHKCSGIIFTVIFDRGPEDRFCLVSGINSITGHTCAKKTCRHHVVYELSNGGVDIVCLNHSACYQP